MCTSRFKANKLLNALAFVMLAAILGGLNILFNFMPYSFTLFVVAIFLAIYPKHYIAKLEENTPTDTTHTRIVMAHVCSYLAKLYIATKALSYAYIVFILFLYSLYGWGNLTP